MRVDLLLKYLCLAKSRSKAKSLCDSGSVTINARPARASSQVKEKDRLEIHYPNKKLVLEVTELPERQLSKVAAPPYYKILYSEEGSGDFPF